MALAGDDAGEDGDHREDAGRQRETEAGDEEERQTGPETGVLQRLGDHPAFVAVCRRCFGQRRGRRAVRVGQVEQHRLRLRWIADAGIGAAL
ncbi:hypothetical protein SDC9_123492 [bioreactor metagenome]|uniref:Uncharacterized protein n=1 Tax=bioreactor metagenome TaxID=1076179 RepID=A0A645CHY3_9ZZZZ